MFLEYESWHSVLPRKDAPLSLQLTELTKLHPHTEW